jgi:uncharacterized iron-regulated membrane protein
MSNNGTWNVLPIILIGIAVLAIVLALVVWHDRRRRRPVTRSTLLRPSDRAAGKVAGAVFVGAALTGLAHPHHHNERKS